MKMFLVALLVALVVGACVSANGPENKITRTSVTIHKIKGEPLCMVYDCIPTSEAKGARDYITQIPRWGEFSCEKIQECQPAGENKLERFLRLNNGNSIIEICDLITRNCEFH